MRLSQSPRRSIVFPINILIDANYSIILRNYRNNELKGTACCLYFLLMHIHVIYILSITNLKSH